MEILQVRYTSRLVLTHETNDIFIKSAEDLNDKSLHTHRLENITLAESIAQQKHAGSYDAKSSDALTYNSLAKECSKIWRLKK